MPKRVDPTPQNFNSLTLITLTTPTTTAYSRKHIMYTKEMLKMLFGLADNVRQLFIL